MPHVGAACTLTKGTARHAPMAGREASGLCEECTRNVRYLALLLQADARKQEGGRAQPRTDAVLHVKAGSQGVSKGSCACARCESTCGHLSTHLHAYACARPRRRDSSTCQATARARCPCRGVQTGEEPRAPPAPSPSIIITATGRDTGHRAPTAARGRACGTRVARAFPQTPARPGHASRTPTPTSLFATYLPACLPAYLPYLVSSQYAIYGGTV